MTPSSAALESFTEQDRFLIEKTEEAIQEGRQLARWCRERDRELALFPLDLKRTYRLPNRAQGFFGTVEINGQALSVMGTRQEVEFGPVTAPNALERLRDFVLGEFLPRAHWTYEDGFPGGFGLEQSLYKTPEGTIGRFPPESRTGCMDWRSLGKRYEWVLLTIYIPDFVMKFGPFRKRFREALCAAAHADFVHVVENPSKEYSLEVSIGYPLLRYAPIPNSFGFGPGKFGTAVKLFSFFLTRENALRVRMVFAATPRCEKVFDFGKHWPDPVYGGARLLHFLALGLWNPQPFHDRLDAQMLAQHCRVHQVLMEGVEKIWTAWVS